MCCTDWLQPTNLDTAPLFCNLLHSQGGHSLRMDSKRNSTPKVSEGNFEDVRVDVKNCEGRNLNSRREHVHREATTNLHYFV